MHPPRPPPPSSHPQLTRACPFCGLREIRVDALRTHIEASHRPLLKLHGRNVVNRKIFWRAKRGVRRIPQSQIDGVLARFKTLRRVRTACQKFVQTVLNLCLVEVKNDAICV